MAPSFEDFTAEDGPEGPGSRLFDDGLDFRASRETSFALLETASQLTLRSGLCPMSVEGIGLFNPLSTEWNKGAASDSFFSMSRMRPADGFDFHDVWEKKSECADQEHKALRQQQLQAQQGVQQPEQHLERQKHETQHTEQGRQPQGQELRRQGQDLQRQPQEATQEQKDLHTHQQEVGRMNVNWELHPAAVSSDGYASEELTHEKNVAKEAGSAWCPTAGFSAAQSHDQGTATTWVAESVAKGPESEAAVHSCATGPSRSTSVRTPAVTDKSGSELFTETSAGGGAVKQKTSSGLVVRPPQQSNEPAALSPPANPPKSDVTAGVGDELGEPRRYSVSSAVSATIVQDAEKWFAPHGALTDRNLSISALVAAASEQAEASAASITGTPLSVPHVEKLREGNCERPVFPDEKLILTKQILATSRNCGSKGRFDTSGGVSSWASSMEDKTHLLSQILPCSSLTSPASTCSSTSSPRCEAAPMNITHAGRLVTLPGIDIVSNVSTAAPTRAGSGNFTGNKILATAERSGLLFSSPSAVASLPEQLLVGHSTSLGIVPPPSVETRGLRKLLTNTPIISEAQEAIFTRQKAFPLSLSAASVNPLSLEHGAKALTDDDEGDAPAETKLRTSTGQGAAGTFGSCSVRGSLRSGSVQDDNLRDENAVAYSDTAVATTASINRTRLPCGSPSAARPFPPSVAEEEGEMWRGTAAAFLESSVSLRSTCENTLGSVAPSPVISTSKLPITGGSVSRSRNTAMAKSTVQATGLKDAAHDHSKEESYLQSLKSHRRADRQEDKTLIGLENSGPPLPAPLLTPPSEQTAEPRIYSGEHPKGRKDAMPKAADGIRASEQPFEGQTRMDTPSRASETRRLRADSYTPVHGGIEGRFPERNASSIPNSCVVHLGDSTPASVPLASVDSSESRPAQHEETSPVFDAFAFPKQLALSSCPREVENLASPDGSKGILTCAQPALLSVPPAPTLSPSLASQSKETFTKKTVGETTACLPLTSSSVSAVELCDIQRGCSTAMERSFSKSEGRSAGLHGTLFTDPDSQQELEAPKLGDVTPTLFGASTPKPVPPLSRTASLQRTADVPAHAGTVHEGEPSRRNLLPWKSFGGQSRPAHLSGASTVLVDSMRKNRQNSGSGNCHDSGATYSHRRYAWYTSAAKRSSSSPITSTCRAKDTTAAQFKSVMPRDACALQPHTNATRGGPTATAGGGGARKPQWSEAEDAMLQKFFEVFHLKWAAISAHLTARFGIPRTGKQCRERWCNHVNPAVKKGGWTPFEDAYILRRQKEMGNRWAAIAKELPGRTENAVKNRFISLSNSRGSGRSGGYSRTSRGVGVDTQERQNGGTNIIRGRTSLTNRRVKTLPEPPQVQANSSGTNSGSGGSEDRINCRKEEGAAQFGSAESTPVDASLGIDVVEEPLHKRRRRGETGAVNDTGFPGIDLTVAVRGEEEKESLFEASLADKGRRCSTSLNEGDESGAPGPQHQLPQLQCALQPSSHGASVSGVGREIAACQEGSRCEASRGDSPVMCLNTGCDGNPARTDVFSECHPRNTVIPGAARRVENWQEQQSRIRMTAVHATVDGRDTHARRRQKQTTTAADISSLPVSRARTSGKENQAKHDVARQQELSRETIVRTPADLEKLRLITKRRALTNSTMSEPPPVWHETAEALLSTGSQAPQKAVPCEPLISQSACSSCVGLCRCAVGNGADAPNESEQSHPVDSHYEGGKAAFTDVRTSTKLVREQMPQQADQRQRHVVQRQRWSRNTHDINSQGLPLQKTSTRVPGSANVEAIDASNVSSALWGVLLAKPTTVRSEAACHSERQNLQRVARQQGTPREAVNLQNSPDHSVVPKDGLKRRCTQEHAETRRTQLTQPSQAFPVLNFPQINQTTQLQSQEAQQQEQGTPPQQKGLQQLRVLRRQSQETGGGLRASASYESTPSQVLSQREDRVFPRAFAQQNSKGQHDSNAGIHTRLQEQHQHGRESEKQPEQHHFGPATNHLQDQLFENFKEHHTLQLQVWKDAQTGDKDAVKGERCSQQLGEFEERRFNLRNHKGAYDSAQKEQHLVICSEMKGESNSTSCADEMSDPAPRQNFTGNLGHKPDRTQQPDILARPSLSNTVQCPLPVNVDDEQEGQQSLRPEGQLQHSSIFSGLPLEKMTTREALELSFVANTSLNDLQTGALRGWSFPALQISEQENTVRCGVRKLFPDTERKQDGLADSHTSEGATNNKKTKISSGIETPQRNPLDGPSQPKLSPTGSSALMETLCSLSQGGCGAAAALNFVEREKSKDTSSVPLSSKGESSFFTFPQTRPQPRPAQPQQQLENQHQLQQLLLPQQQPQQPPGAAAQVPASLENPLISLRNCIWSGYDRQSDENLTGSVFTVNEDHLSYLSRCSLPATTELSATKLCGGSFAPSNKEEQGFNLNISAATGTAYLLDPALERRTAIAGPIEGERVAVTVQDVVEGGPAELPEGCATEKAAAHAVAAGTAGEDALAMTLSTEAEAGKMRATFSSFQQLRAPEKVRFLEQQEQTQHPVPPLSMIEQGTPCRAACADSFGPSTYVRGISSGVPEVTERITHLSSQLSSHPPRLPAQEGDSIPSVTPRQATAASHDSTEEFIVDKAKISPRRECEASIPILSTHDFRTCCPNEAVHEGTKQGSFCKPMGGSLHQGNVRRALPLTSLGREDSSQPHSLQRAQEPDSSSRRTSSTGGSLLPLQNEQEPGRLCIAIPSAQIEASAFLTDVAASSSSALVKDDAESQPSAGHGGIHSVYVDEKLGLDVEDQRGRQHIQEQQPLHGQREWRRSYEEAQEWLLGGRFLMAGTAATDEESKSVSVDQQVAVQKHVIAGSEKASVQEKEFVFEELAAEASRHPQLEDTSAPSAAGEPIFEMHALPPYVPHLC